MPPLEFVLGFGGISNQCFHFRRAEIIGVDANQLPASAGFDTDLIDSFPFPFQGNTTELKRLLNKIPNTVLISGG